VENVKCNPADNISCLDNNNYCNCRSPPRPLLAVPNVTAHPSTASVPITRYCCITVRYSAVLMCLQKGYNAFICGLLSLLLLLLMMMMRSDSEDDSYRRDAAIDTNFDSKLFFYLSATSFFILFLQTISTYAIQLPSL